MLDIILWLPKVKVGGIISGHDFYSNSKAQMGVREAVEAYVAQHKIFPYFLTDSQRKPHHKGDRHSSWFWVKE